MPSGITLEPISALNVTESVFASPNTKLPFAVILPAATMFPVKLAVLAVTVILVSESLVSTVADPALFEIPIIVSVVVNSRTSIESAEDGASVNVNVVPTTAYAVIGF